MKTKRALWVYRGTGDPYEVGSSQWGSDFRVCVYVFSSVDGIPPFRSASASAGSAA